jgi:hydrogenase-4 component E
MSDLLLDPGLVIALLLNFFMLTMSRLNQLVYAVAAQGALLGLLYPIAHEGFLTASADNHEGPFMHFRLLLLTVAIVGIKGRLIPWFLMRAIRIADIRSTVTSLIGFVPTLLLGATATMLAVVFARSLPLPHGIESHLLIPASLATVLTGFILLITRREAMAQVLGYIVLENGVFIFGLLLIEAVPLLVELGVVLDLFVGVFVMGIIFNHVRRAFPAASSEHLSTLKE